MLDDFLDANRTTLIERCHARAARRLAPRPLPQGLAHGIPVLLGQVIESLRIEHPPGAPEGRRPAAAFGAVGFRMQNDIDASGARHGHELLLQRHTVDEVVHEYADLVQAIVELAIELDEPVSRDEFGTLDRCVDHAIAGATSEFCRQRDRLGAVAEHRVLGERLALLTQDLRGLINTAMLAFVAIKEGGVGLHGATSAVLERSLVGLNDLMEHALRDVRVDMGAPARIGPVAVELFMGEATVAGTLEARSRGRELVVSPVEPGLVMEADTQLLHSAVFGLVQNALRFTRPQGHVWLRAHATAERVLIEVEDQCAGCEGQPPLPLGPFASASRGGPGYGLSISRRAVEAMGGTLRFADLPGVGCVSTIELPRGVDAPANVLQRTDRIADRR